MKRELLEILRCPVCLGELDLSVEREDEEIIKGTLKCKKCGRIYSIEEGIPMMLPELAKVDKNDNR